MSAGWSNISRRTGTPRQQTGDPCFYCGVPGCDECGTPPAMLNALAIDQDDDEPAIDQDYVDSLEQWDMQRGEL